MPQQERVRRRRIAVLVGALLLLIVVAHFTRSIWISRVAGSAMTSVGDAIIESTHEATSRSHARQVRLPIWFAWLSADGSAVYIFHQGEDYVFFPCDYGFPAGSGVFYSQDGGRPSGEVAHDPMRLNGRFWSGNFNYGIAEPRYF